MRPVSQTVAGTESQRLSAQYEHPSVPPAAYLSATGTCFYRRMLYDRCFIAVCSTPADVIHRQCSAKNPPIRLACRSFSHLNIYVGAMDPIPCYPDTAAQVQLRAHFETAQEQLHEALVLYSAALQETEGWISTAGAKAVADLETAETVASRASLSLLDLNDAIQRHFRAEDAARYFLQSSGVAN